MKKIIKKEYIIGIALFVICFFTSNFIFADAKVTLNNEDLEEKVNKMLDTNSNNIDVNKLVDEYEELSKNYTNDQIADMIEKNQDKLEKKGISQSAISAGTNILRTTDPNQVTKILKEDVNVEDMQNKINEGYSPNEVVEELATTLTIEQKIVIFLKFLFANTIFKTFFVIFIIYVIYRVILRWIIYSKAGKHGFASIIPIYRDIIYFKVCQMSPWVILFILIPVIGWLILIILKIISRFELAYSFDKNSGFGFGLWVFPTIFESVIAFSNKMKYVGD